MSNGCIKHQKQHKWTDALMLCHELAENSLIMPCANAKLFRHNAHHNPSVAPMQYVQTILRVFLASLKTIEQTNSNANLQNIKICEYVFNNRSIIFLYTSIADDQRNVLHNINFSKKKFLFFCFLYLLCCIVLITSLS